MYCVNCGVKLADTESRCPLCGVRAYHPDLSRTPADPLYPQDAGPHEVDSHGLRIAVSAAFLLAALVCFLCDLQLSGGISWSGYAMGGILIAYSVFVLPGWFKAPNPVILIPCVFLLIHGYLLYISLITDGAWYLSFAFPVAGFVGVLATAVAGLLRYISKGAVYVIAGAVIALGAFMPLMGFLLNLTFFTPSFAFWSLYPGVSLVLAGLTLIFLALCRPARQAVKRNFFI
ncbi:MAG: hypothetical protein E7437_04290 [Ruminococcaceae bacterium]|nr:hypothetical protein [Oscillospiraceae bacterium]